MNWHGIYEVINIMRNVELQCNLQAQVMGNFIIIL